MRGTVVKLSTAWTVGDEVGSGGFGRVFAIDGGPKPSVIKFIPKQPGAQRELLFEDLSGVRNVVPILDSGEHEDFWVIVMPRAEVSLRRHLDSLGGACTVPEALPILVDVTTALVDLSGRVVHRDIKPENILRLDGHWCLADFGISRYAEASTAPDTHKWSMTPAYAAPERWRAERATGSADVYSLGVMAYEMVSRGLPFAGPSMEDFREQHLYENPAPLSGAPLRFATLVDECLFKSPSARPTPATLLKRLLKQKDAPHSESVAALVAANHEEVQRLAEADRRASRAATAAEVRGQRVKASRVTLGRIATTLLETILDAAPAARTSSGAGWMWSIQLGSATLSLSTPKEVGGRWGSWEAPIFSVDAWASIDLRVPASRDGWEGRSHSLWFGDIQEADSFAWFETAFMITPLMRRQTRLEPFALEPGESAAKAVWSGIAEYQVAWPFTRVNPDDMDEFIDRWVDWLARAASGQLGHPSQMPERSTQGTWRRR